MEKVVRLGDGSSHGGSMVSAGSSVVVNGITMCVDGDSHACPIRGHGVTSVTGTSTVASGGKRVVKVGDSAGCGAVLTQGSPNVRVG
jgi:uncharacterized Zn-binding protein involved in type VI secretion